MTTLANNRIAHLATLKNIHMTQALQFEAQGRTQSARREFILAGQVDNRLRGLKQALRRQAAGSRFIRPVSVQASQSSSTVEAMGNNRLPAELRTSNSKAKVAK